MFPLSLSSYMVIIFAVLAMGGLGYGKYESAKYEAYKNEVELIAAKQEAKNIEIAKEQALINKGIQNAYDAKIAAVRNYYSNGLLNSSSGKLPSFSATTTIADARTAYTILAGQCAETTAQAVALQDWIKQQVGLNEAK